MLSDKSNSVDDTIGSNKTDKEEKNKEISIGFVWNAWVWSFIARKWNPGDADSTFQWRQNAANNTLTSVITPFIISKKENSSSCGCIKGEGTSQVGREILLSYLGWEIWRKAAVQP